MEKNLNVLIVYLYSYDSLFDFEYLLCIFSNQSTT